MAKDKLGSTYLKPLMRGLEESPERVLMGLRDELALRLKAKMKSSTLSERAKKSFARAITVRSSKSSVIIESSHPGLTRLIEGQKGGQMKWLQKSKVPIPIVTDTGELIFRTASPRSMENGKWIHPGRKPYTFVDLAREETKKLVREHFGQALVSLVTGKKRK